MVEPRDPHAMCAKAVQRWPGLREPLLGTGRPGNVCSAATIVLTNAGRLLCQRRRQGYQCFGGSARQDCWYGWLYGAFSEVWDECRIDLWTHRNSVQQMAGPFFVVQNLDHSDTKQPETCLVLIVVLDDSLFSPGEAGTVIYDGHPVWSAELARKYSSRCLECYSYSALPVPCATDDIRVGQVWWDRSIFVLLDVQNLRCDDWRGVDWITIAMLRHQVETLCSRTMSTQEHRDLRWSVVSFASADATYISRLQSYMELVKETECLFIASKPWPLLEHGHVVYSREWRLRFNSVGARKRPKPRTAKSGRRLHLLRLVREKRKLAQAASAVCRQRAATTATPVRLSKR